MTKGVVKFFHDEKGYGFIEVEDQEEDVFFHISEVDALTVAEGEEVEFEVQPSDRGPRAVDVRIIA